MSCRIGTALIGAFPAPKRLCGSLRPWGTILGQQGQQPIPKASQPVLGPLKLSDEGHGQVGPGDWGPIRQPLLDVPFNFRSTLTAGLIGFCWTWSHIPAGHTALSQVGQSCSMCRCGIAGGGDRDRRRRRAPRARRGGWRRDPPGSRRGRRARCRRARVPTRPSGPGWPREPGASARPQPGTVLPAPVRRGPKRSAPHPGPTSGLPGRRHRRRRPRCLAVTFCPFPAVVAGRTMVVVVG